MKDEHDNFITIRNRKHHPLLSCVDNGASVSTSACSCPSCNPSPIIIGLDNGFLQLTGPEDEVLFDLTADGTPRQTAWTQGGHDDAFLALDRNGNGLIDDGSELFGGATPYSLDHPGSHGPGHRCLRGDGHPRVGVRVAPAGRG